MKKMISPRRVIVVCIFLSLIGCKASSSSNSIARLRGASTNVTVAATFKIGSDQRLKIALIETSPSPTTSPSPAKSPSIVKNSAAITQIKIAFPQSMGNSVDLTKAVNGQILLTTASKVNVSAKITHGPLSNADCQATDVPLSATPVQANFVCTSTGGPDSGTDKKYPPNVTDPALRKAYDQLALECAKTKTNIAVVDPDDKAITYGCYCSKVDSQLLYESFANSVDAFSARCLGSVATPPPTLTTQLQQACQAANTVQPAPMPMHANADGSDPKNVSCPCPVSTTGTQTTAIKYADLYGFYRPLEVFAKKRSECPI